MTKPMLRFMFLLGGAPLKATSPSLRIMLREQQQVLGRLRCNDPATSILSRTALTS